MNVSQRRPMSVAEFLEWEEGQELRYEFDGSQLFAMTGGSYEHDAISMNLAAALVTRLKGKRCRAHGSHLKIAVMGSIRYPDACVSCAPISRGAKMFAEPVVIFEVLSPSTAATDQTDKHWEYARTASVRRYVMLEQDAVAATMFERVGDDWVCHIRSKHDVIRMPEIDVELPLAELYLGINLSDRVEP